MNWDAIAAIVQAIQTAAVIVALVYAWQQVKQARQQVKHSRQEVRLGALWEIFKELDTDELRASRRYVYKNWQLYHLLRDDVTRLDSLPNEAWKRAQDVSNTLDRLGFMVYQGLFPKRLIWGGYRYVIARSWKALKPFINSVRKKRKQESYQFYFEHLAKNIGINLDEIEISNEPC